MKRITENYDQSDKTQVYGEIQARRAERAGKGGKNTFDGINSNTSKDDMVAALEMDDEQDGAGDSVADDNETHGSGASTESSLGKDEEPENIPIPDGAKIKRDPVATGTAPLSQGASVKGDQSLMVIDVVQNSPVQVFLLESKPLNPESNPLLVFIQGTVSSELLPADNAKAKFACKKDGTVIYNARGFDDVPHAEFDMVDIVKLVQHNHGEKIDDES